MKEKLKKWWLSRWNVIHVSFGVALSTVYVHFKILDYGMDFEIKLPFALNKLNPINLLTKEMLRIVKKLCGKADYYSLCKYWKLSKWKYLELEVVPYYAILSFAYDWCVHCDHWGHEVDITVAGLEFSASFHDARHWNNETDAPMTEEEIERENQEYLDSLTNEGE